MNKLKTLIIIALIIIALAAIKIFFLGKGQDAKSSMKANGPMPPSPVTIYVTIQRQLDNNVFVTGSTIANEEVILMPEVSGKIISLSITEGTSVTKGELLVKINDSDLLAQLKKLEAQKKLNEDKIQRAKELLSIKGISQEEFDSAQNLLDGIKADIDFTKAQISKTEIRAPFNGIIGLRSVSEGSLVTPATRIAAIQQINPIKIDFSVPEKYADVLSINDVMQFSVSENAEQFSAKVYAIEPKIDPATRTVQLRALAENKNGKIFPGAFAKIRLPLKKIENAIMVPSEAIIPVLQGKCVFICKNGKAMQIPVETGIRTDSLIQITSGLHANDSVITTGIMQIKTGSIVKIVNK